MIELSIRAADRSCRHLFDFPDIRQGLIEVFLQNSASRSPTRNLGSTFALIFVGIPFVARAVQPVLEKLDGSYEEAARVMVRSLDIFSKESFFRNFFLRFYRTGLAFGRCLGEYGSVVFIAGKQNLTRRDHTTHHHVRTSEFDYKSATSIALRHADRIVSSSCF